MEIDDFEPFKWHDIDEFPSFNKKEQYFQLNINIETERDFNARISQLEKFQKQKLIFRGHKKAGYKLWTSAHRDWIQSGSYDLFTDFVLKKINEYKEWNNGDIMRHLYLNGANTNNDIALLSYAQHSGLPTPFIDFSYNPFVALYFAMEKCSSTSRKKINQYSSLYFVNPKWHVFDGRRILFEKFISKKGNLLDLTYDNFKLIPYFIMDYDNAVFRHYNSQNIINQEGIFYCYNVFGKSLEERFKMDTTFARDSKRLPDGDYRICGCFNISHNLRDYILTWLNDRKGINKDFIYPDKPLFNINK